MYYHNHHQKITVFQWKSFFPLLFIAGYPVHSMQIHAVNIDDNDGDFLSDFFFIFFFTITLWNDVYILTWYVPAMCDSSCLGGSRLPRCYRVWCQWLTAWWVGDTMISRHRRMIQHQLLVYYQAQDVVSLVAQWDERMRSMQSGCGLLWLHYNIMTERGSVRADRLHEVPADRDHALICHPRLARWRGCHPVTVYGPYNAQSVILT